MATAIGDDLLDDEGALISLEEINLVGYGTRDDGLDISFDNFDLVGDGGGLDANLLINTFAELGKAGAQTYSASKAADAQKATDAASIAKGIAADKHLADALIDLGLAQKKGDQSAIAANQAVVDIATQDALAAPPSDGRAAACNEAVKKAAQELAAKPKDAWSAAALNAWKSVCSKAYLPKPMPGPGPSPIAPMPSASTENFLFQKKWGVPVWGLGLGALGVGTGLFFTVRHFLRRR